ncbi:hypothetical protein [Glutamicibacter arilaitensis]|uniref:hypothetical protein n=1 Tax=Glutamicibacter arilaitensis TaxID=256701 RepID=UPI003FD35FA5
MTTTTGERQSFEADAWKFCNGCGEDKPLEAYHRQAGTRDGRKSRCRDCVAEVSATWRARNREDIRAKAAEYRARPENKVRARANSAAWRKRQETSK